MTPSGGHPRELLEAALEGGLGADDRRRFAAHLKGCRACRVEYRLAHALRTVGGNFRGSEPLTARELARLEAGVWSRTGLAEAPVGWNEPARPWMVAPAVAVGVAAAGLLLWAVGRTGGPGVGTGQGVTAALRSAVEPDRAARVPQRGDAEAVVPAGLTHPELTAPPRAGWRAITVDDFERVADLGLLSVSGQAALRLDRGGVSGRRSFSPGLAGGADAPLEIELPVPAAGRSQAAGISVWVRATGGEVLATALVGGNGGATREVGPVQRIAPSGWTRVVFVLSGEAGAGPAWVRFQFTGQGQVELDKVEVWVMDAKGPS